MLLFFASRILKTSRNSRQPAKGLSWNLYPTRPLTIVLGLDRTLLSSIRGAAPKFRSAGDVGTEGIIFKAGIGVGKVGVQREPGDRRVEVCPFHAIAAARVTGRG